MGHGENSQNANKQPSAHQVVGAAALGELSPDALVCGDLVAWASNLEGALVQNLTPHLHEEKAVCRVVLLFGQNSMSFNTEDFIKTVKVVNTYYQHHNP